MTARKHRPYLDDIAAGPAPQTSHPAYVAVAPDWFWDQGDERSPFGSDDGNDTLQVLQGHFIQGGVDEHVPGCIADLIVEWAFVPESVWDSSQEEIVAWLDASDDHIRFMHGEVNVYIAAACGQFKISGWIHPALRFWAERAMMLVQHVLDGWEQQKFGAEPGRYAERLAAARAVISAAPDPPKRLQLRMYAEIGA